MYSNTLLQWDYHNTGIVKDLDVQQHTVTVGLYYIGQDVVHKSIAPVSTSLVSVIQ